MDELKCPKCQKLFSRRDSLKRHLEKKKPCVDDPKLLIEPMESNTHRCEHCQKKFESVQSKRRHERQFCSQKSSNEDPTPPNNDNLQQEISVLKTQIACLLTAKATSEVTTEKPPQRLRNANIVVNGPVIHSNGPVFHADKMQNNMINVDSSVALAGWPPKWPAPMVPPNLFEPCGYVISMNLLSRVLLKLGEDKTEACRRGDPKAISDLLVEIIRQVHADPQERNIYLSPERSDQVLVHVPNRWKPQTLKEAIKFMFEHVLGEISSLPIATLPMGIQQLTTKAKEGFAKQKVAIVQTSQGALSAHLKGLQALLREDRPDESLLAWSAQAGPRRFGHERLDHLMLEEVIGWLEVTTGIYTPEDITRENMAEITKKLLAAFVRKVVTGHAENVTIAPLAGNEKALVYTLRGWEERSAQVAGTELAHKMLEVMIQFLEAYTKTPLALMISYLKSNIAELAKAVGENGELLALYVKYASDICAKSQAPPFLELRKRLGEHDALVRSKQPTPGPIITDLDLCEILGL